VAASLNILAGLYCNQGKYAQAEPLYKRSLCDGKKTCFLILSRYATVDRQLGCSSVFHVAIPSWLNANDG
jgi:hypothetical protein